MGMLACASAHDAGVASIRIVRQPSHAWRFELQTPLPGLDRSMRRFHEARSRGLGELDTGGTRYDEAGQTNVLWHVDGERSEHHVLGADDDFTVIDSAFYAPIEGR